MQTLPYSTHTIEQRGLLSREEAAAHLGCSVRLLDYRVADGEIDAYKMSHRVLFDPAELDHYLAG